MFPTAEDLIRGQYSTAEAELGLINRLVVIVGVRLSMFLWLPLGDFRL